MVRGSCCTARWLSCCYLSPRIHFESDAAITSKPSITTSTGGYHLSRAIGNKDWVVGGEEAHHLMAPGTLSQSLLLLPGGVRAGAASRRSLSHAAFSWVLCKCWGAWPTVFSRSELCLAQVLVLCQGVLLPQRWFGDTENKRLSPLKKGWQRNCS